MVYIPKTDDFLKILTDKEVIHYQSFIRKKNRKSVKQSETNTYQPKTFENLKIDDIKSVIYYRGPKKFAYILQDYKKG